MEDSNPTNQKDMEADLDENPFTDTDSSQQRFNNCQVGNNQVIASERCKENGTRNQEAVENDDIESNHTDIHLNPGDVSQDAQPSNNLVQSEIVGTSFNENPFTATNSSSQQRFNCQVGNNQVITSERCRENGTRNQEAVENDDIEGDQKISEGGDKIHSTFSVVKDGILRDVNDEDAQNSQPESQEESGDGNLSKDEGIYSDHVHSTFQEGHSVYETCKQVVTTFFAIIAFFITASIFTIIFSSVVKVPPQHYAHPLQDLDPGGLNVSSLADIPTQQPYSQCNLRAGDIILIPRLYGLYYHFAIYVGNGSVVHLTGNILEFAIWKVKVKKEKLEDISIPNGSLIERGTWKGKERLPKDEIIDRCNSKVDEIRYSLFFYNCETFVRWAVYGVEESEQPNIFQIIVLGLIILSFMFALRVFLISVSKFVNYLLS